MVAINGISRSKWMGWICAETDDDRWLQVDFKTPQEIVAIEIRGTGILPQFTQNFKLAQSENGLEPWSWYGSNGDPKIFQGNLNEYEPVFHCLDPSIMSRFLRIYPLEYVIYPVIKWELYTCRKDLLASIHSSRAVLTANDTLPTAFQVPGSPRPAIPADILDDVTTTCIRIPPSGQAPGEVKIQLEGHMKIDFITRVSLLGNGLQCNDQHISAMVQESKADSCSGTYKLCSVAEGVDECRVTCSSELHAHQMFSMQISLTIPAHTDARLCEAKRVD
ncbi:hypothetical protein CAPTEDRAFT_207558 [Capitella teleta]|uniref:F5/8 type C domain-containing protein n=1 Tax=Capitella teleta TaxID=283909 RepID=R7V7L5_CAPTE|nr:hypothetical protein CAPTEDRAFT_207558 [Capitella teleta]|eukprot:ELU14848.1 hypothetical protein CAPTEDRAFT_207558 [Capitella teleta]